MQTLDELYQALNLDPQLIRLLQTSFQSCAKIAELLPQQHSAPTQSVNASGEIQQALDILANDILKQDLKNCQCAFALSSEEEDDAVLLNSEANYVIAYDPLDGSSNIDVNINVGTIFSILPKRTDALSSLLQKGIHQVAAAYVLYGATTSFALAICPNRINTKTTFVRGHLHNNHMDWLIEVVNPHLPEKKELAVNIGNFNSWSHEIQSYVKQAIQQGDYSFRYVGSMVADIQRILIRGGVFLYPYDTLKQQAKLRLLYEANPVAMLIEACKGGASDGYQRLLDIQPQSLHQRTAVIMGSASELAKLNAWRA